MQGRREGVVYAHEHTTLDVRFL